jgi:hypothetical protein
MFLFIVSIITKLIGAEEIYIRRRGENVTEIKICFLTEIDL